MKGNAIVGQSGGPTAVINASLYGVIRSCLQQPEIGKVYGMRHGIEGFMESHIVNLGAEEEVQLDRLPTTPSSALGSCRYKLKDDDLGLIQSLLERFDIRYLFMIGGNDTMDTIHRIESSCRRNGYELRGVGIPKTVDNDLYGTDFTPGFPSAARYVALSVVQSGRLALDMQKVDRFVVHQTVGRDAGWLAAASAMARLTDGDAPHLILLPERPVSRENLLKKVKTVLSEVGWIYIVVGEGAVWENGKPISAASATDGFSNIEFGAMGGSSAALNLHTVISRETGFRGEFQITESLSMCADDRTSEIDRKLARACGVEAVRLAHSGESGAMVTIERGKEGSSGFALGTVPLKDVAVRSRPMPDEYIDESGMGITESFVTYMTPLVEPMPDYARFAFQEVSP